VLTLVLVGLGVTAATIAIHIVGSMAWLQFLFQRCGDDDGRFVPRARLAILVGTAVVLICLHFIEILLWAVSYVLVAPGELGSFEAALYFSAVTFTTLGYGDITLSSTWRLLSGFEAINGVLLLGWTTAFLFAVLQRAWGSAGNGPNQSNS